MANYFISIVPEFDLKSKTYIYPIDKLSIFIPDTILNEFFFLFLNYYRQEGYLERLSEIQDIRTWINFEYKLSRQSYFNLEEDHQFQNFINKNLNSYYERVKTKKYNFDEFIKLPQIKSISDVMDFFYFIDDKGELEKESVSKLYNSINSNKQKLKLYYEKEYCLYTDTIILTPEFVDESENSKDIEKAFIDVENLGRYLLSKNPYLQLVISAPTITKYQDELNADFYSMVMNDESEIDFENEMRHWENMARDEESSMDRETDGFWRDI
jgi:hypothetical protein